MREIKFRFYDKENKEMNYCDLEDLCKDDYWFDGKTEVWSVLYDSNNEQATFVVMQYTGLKDKNEKEIFEGDIVKVFSDTRWITGKVIYEHCGFIVDITNNKDLVFGRVEIIEKFIEVIGNIYNNPELLEKGE